MGKTLMIIGAGIEQVPAYERAKARGLTVVGTDANPDAPGLRFADDRIIASTRDAAATASAALNFHASHPIHGVMTIANDVPFTVASVADAIGLRSMGIESATLISNKLLMKQRFASHGVACPWFSDVRSIQEIADHMAASPSNKFVLKPVDGRGARGVLLLDDDTDLEWAFAESTRWGESGQLILEAFVPGMQLSTETFIQDGKCYTPAIAERNYTRLQQFSPFIIEDGGTIPAPISASLKGEIDDLILRGAASLGIQSGIIKGDLVIDENGHPMIIELAGRLSGGWFATHQIPAATGVSLVDAVISHALGAPVDPATLTPQFNHATAIRYWFPPEGVIHAISGEDQLCQTPGLLAYGFFRKVGDIQPRIRMHPDRFGYVIVTGKHREEAIQRVERALACVQIEVTP